VKTWDLPSRTILQVFGGAKGDVNAVTVLNSTSQVVFAGTDGNLNFVQATVRRNSSDTDRGGGEMPVSPTTAQGSSYCHPVERVAYKAAAELTVPAELDVSDCPFDDVIEFIEISHDIDIVLRPTKPTDASFNEILSGHLINLSVTDRPLNELLRRVARSTDVHFRVDDGIVSMRPSKSISIAAIGSAVPSTFLASGTDGFDQTALWQ
jgi:hypothetical protein